MLVIMRSLRSSIIRSIRTARTLPTPPPILPDNLYKLALVVRTDLGMSRGKIASQAAHGAILAVCNLSAASCLKAWKKCGQPKVVLRVTEESLLLSIATAARTAGIPVSLVYDAGHTQIDAGTLTVAAVGPALATDVDKVTGALKLL
jgi:PTH2 family peptidyl-tRNA hydrolase